MRVLKVIVLLCFLIIVAFISLTYIQLPEIKGYELEMGNIPPCYNTGWRPLDIATCSFYYMIKSPTITSELLVFMYFVGVVAASYTGLVLGLVVAIAERKKTDFIFMLSFVTCLFFTIFTTAIAILV